MRTATYLTSALIIIIVIALFAACENIRIRSIEDTISQFESAVNNQDFSSFKDTLSEDSIDWITGDIGIQGFLDYFYGAFPLSYGELTVTQTSGVDATVDTQATYYNHGVPVTVQFVMRKHDQVWKVRQYWDDWSGSFSNIWQKVGQAIILEEQ